MRLDELTWGEKHELGTPADPVDVGNLRIFVWRNDHLDNTYSIYLYRRYWDKDESPFFDLQPINLDPFTAQCVLHYLTNEANEATNEREE